MDRDDIDRLIGLREKYGLKGRHPGYVKYNKNEGPERF